MMNSIRLSPLHDALQSAHEHPRAAWGEVRGMPVPLQFGEPAKELLTARVLGLADVSFLPRVVVKGPQAVELLQSQQIPIPGDLFSVSPLAGGGLIARTGGSEFFLEDGVQGDTVARVEAALAAGHAGAYRVLRQDAALILSGTRAGELFRHISSYDFLSDAGTNLVFTQVANVSCSVLPCELQGIPAFRLWTDGTFGIYVWETLLEIAREFGGDAVGTAVFYDGLVDAR